MVLESGNKGSTLGSNPEGVADFWSVSYEKVGPPRREALLLLAVGSIGFKIPNESLVS
jgi:hypothetical protein